MKNKIVTISCLALCAFSLVSYASPPNDPPAKNSRFDSPPATQALVNIPAPYVLTFDKTPATSPDLLAAFSPSDHPRRVTVEITQPLEFRPALITPGDYAIPSSLLDVSTDREPGQRLLVNTGDPKNLARVNRNAICRVS